MAKETFSSLIDLFKTTTSSSSTVTLVCSVCGTKLSLFRKKKPCAECRRMFCTQCLGRCQDRALRCRNCFILTMRPPDRVQLLTLRAKDLQHYLNQHNVSTRGCVEKEDLVNVILRHASKPSPTGYAGSTSNTSPEAASSVDGSSQPQNTSSTPTNVIPPSPAVQINDSDSSSTTSFEMIQRPGSGSSQENLESVPSSSSTSSSGAAGRSGTEGSPEEEHTNEQQVEVNIAVHPQNDATQNTALLEDSSEPHAQSSSCQLSTASSSPNSLRVTMALISCEADLEGLTVKQLKDMLVRHRVNYRGCCEKGELVDRAKILYRDYCASRVDLDKLELNELCKICMDAPVECVMLECGHMATCTDCGRQLSECPICRQYVVRIVRTFKA